MRIHSAPQTFAKMARDVASLNLGARTLRPLCRSRPFVATSRRTPEVATGVGCDRTTGRSDVFGRIRVRCRANLRSSHRRMPDHVRNVRVAQVAHDFPQSLALRSLRSELDIQRSRLLLVPVNAGARDGVALAWVPGVAEGGH